MNALSPPPTAAADTRLWAHLNDEQLVELAQQRDGARAQGELLRRCGSANARLVRRLAARSGLQDADRMDVEQETVFWTLEAIRHYRAGTGRSSRSCRFRTFMYRVVSVRFIDYFRRLRRERQIGRPGAPIDGAAADATELNDLRTSVDRELDRLGPDARLLWGLLAEGIALRRAASELGISYDMAKRQRRHLFARLRVALGD